MSDAKKNVDITIIWEERICWPLESAFRIPKETLLVSESADRQILLRKRLLVICMPYGFNDGNITIKILVAQQLNICLSNGPPWFNSQELVWYHFSYKAILADQFAGVVSFNLIVCLSTVYFIPIETKLIKSILALPVEISIFLFRFSDES